MCFSHSLSIRDQRARKWKKLAWVNAIYLPLEVFTREWPGKLLLACSLASCGYVSVVGHKTFVRRIANKAYRPGVFFNIAARKKEAANAQELREKRFRFVAQDEEAGTIFGQYVNFYSGRSADWMVEEFDRFFCWGQDEYDFHQKHTSNANGLLVSGGLRSIFWGGLGRQFHLREIDELKEKYGRYVLFTTNFKYSNSILTLEQQERWRSKDSGWSKGGREHFYSQVESDQRLFEDFVKGIQVVLDETELNVVLKPHPMEQPEVWLERLGHHPRLFIVSGVEATPLILAAQACVQNSCSTGLESAAAGIPTINLAFDPDDFVRDGKSVPDQLGCRADSPAALVAALGALEPPRPSKLLHDKVAYCGTSTPVAVMTDEIQQLVDEIKGGSNGRFPVSTMIKQILRNLRSSLAGQRERLSSDAQRVENTKRPEISLETARVDVERICDLVDIKVPLTIKQLEKSTFEIRRDRK